MKRFAHYALLPSLVAASVPALAHPGDHAQQSVVAGIAHVLTDPWHVGLALVGVLVVAVLGRRRKRRGRGTRS